MAQPVRGKVTQIIGPVVDIQFPPDQLPEIYDAVEIQRDGDGKLVLEVQQHLGGNWVRCLAMDSTDGLQRGTEAIPTGAPILVPVGEATLGRLLNVLGEPIDRRGTVDAEERRPIHQAPPSFEEQSTSTEVFETGLKVIDLVAPFTKGGRPGSLGEPASERRS
jgi:F-type H+-transporting ATPase subunit beta